MDCQIHDSRLVRRIDSSGRCMYTYQCQVCGEIDRDKTGQGPWVPKPGNVDLESLPLWNDDVRKAAIDRARFAAESAAAEQVQKRLDEYDAYMCSDKWSFIRQKRLAHDNWLCQGCLEAVAEHVHHLTYERFGNELMCDLVSLCIDCHQICHPHRDLRGRARHGHPIAVH